MRTALPVKFPDDQGKNRELLAFVALLPASAAPKVRVYTGLLSQIPYSTEQGILIGYQGTQIP
jgi:hypothetical protein